MSLWILNIVLWVRLVWLVWFSPSARYWQKLDREKEEHDVNFRFGYRHPEHVQISPKGRSAIMSAWRTSNHMFKPNVTLPRSTVNALIEEVYRLARTREAGRNERREHRQ